LLCIVQHTHVDAGLVLQGIDDAVACMVNLIIANHPFCFLSLSPAVYARSILAVIFCNSMHMYAAAACPVFASRRITARRLQPAPILGFKLSQRALEHAAQQLQCSSSTHRLLLLCCCRPLSFIALRLSRAREGSLNLERAAIARIMRRCLSTLVWRQWLKAHASKKLPCSDATQRPSSAPHARIAAKSKLPCVLC
jgi:hypothetical protein